ncbi:MAG: DUF3179 domain-containing protein [Halobacteriaceae archaeon]
MDIQDVLPRDEIPSIDEPSFKATYFGNDDDEMIVIEADPPRAYPVRILSYHEIVNDWLEPGDAAAPRTASATSGDRQPIAVTWCPICASAVVYDRVVDGQHLTFGTSGKLADDALVMYDRETGSEWKQPLGEAISGPLEGRSLSVRPASMLSWQRFQAEYPNGVVLQPVHGGRNSRDQPPSAAYDMTPYDQYDATDAFGLRAMRGEGPERTWAREDLQAKTPVLGLIHDGEAVAYPLPQVEAAGGVVTDSVGGLTVLVVSADDDLHAFEHPGHQVTHEGGELRGDGASWDPATGRSDDGRQLTRLPARRSYAFAWQDDHGPESFYGLH